MNEVMILRADQCSAPLETAAKTQTQLILTYKSRGKWRVAKVLIAAISQDKFTVECINTRAKPMPINIQIGQTVGLSFKHTRGKFVLDTEVKALEPPTSACAGGSIVLDMPNQIEVLQRRSYFRVNVPESLLVDVRIWHRSSKSEQPDPSRTSYQGRLVDISAGGAQVAVEKHLTMAPSPDTRQSSGSKKNNEPVFRKGRFITMQFTPVPYEEPLLVSAQIRNILPTRNGSSAFLGLQLVGLEATQQGHEILRRLACIVEQYHSINEAGPKHQDMQATTTGNPTAPRTRANSCEQVPVRAN